MARAFTPDDAVRLKTVSDPQISPAGQAVAFVSGDSFTGSGKDAPKMPRTRIYLATLSGDAPVQLTAGPRSDAAPRWSPDGTAMAFLSDRAKDGERQVYLLSSAGGEARRLTSVDGSIPSPRSLNPLKWHGDGARISFLMIDGDTPDEKKEREAGSDEIDFEARHKFQRLWTLDPATGAVECVSPEGLQIWEFDISPDGRRAVAVVSDHPYEWDWYRCRIAVFDLKASSQASTIYRNKRQVAKPTWSPDGRQIAFLTSNWSDRGVDAGDVMIMPSSGSGGSARNLTERHEVSYDSIRWHDGQIVAGANVDGGSGVARIDPASGRTTWLWQDRVALGGWSIAANGTLAAVYGTLHSLRQVYVSVPPSDAGRPATATSARATALAGRRPAAAAAATSAPEPSSEGGRSWKQLSSLHVEFKDVTLPSYSEVQWKAADGLELHGFLALPPGRAPGGAQGAGRTRTSAGPLPTVLLAHGGPTSACRAGIEDSHRWATFLASAGLAVFMPNYRGSTGRGVAFAESNLGDMGGRDLGDMLSGLDHLVATGVADPDRLGVAGWSYGGFTAMWAITQTDRFKAAVAGAGICDWRSFHGRSYLQTWDSIHYGDADPYDPESPHSRFSAINYIKRVRTPTLILHGEQDGDVPVEQSYQFFRALQELGVESKLVVYPRERHGPTELNHVLDINRRAAGWLVERLAKSK